jgi:hypothetical protein
MNDSNDFERLVANRFARESSFRARNDEAIHDLMNRAGRVRQRPRWLAFLKEPPMRHASRVVVGSPTARVATVGAVTILLALLATGAFVIGAQPPSPAPPEVPAAQLAPVSFTGHIVCGDEVRGGSMTTSTFQFAEGNGSVTSDHGHAWEQSATMSDPRLEGTHYHSRQTDIFMIPSSTRMEQRVITWATQRIENDGGSWQGTMLDFVRQGESGYHETYLLTGAGGYEGLSAIYDIAPAGACAFDVWGVIFEGDLPAAEAFITK